MKKTKQTVVRGKRKDQLQGSRNEEVRHVTFRLPMDLVTKIEGFCRNNDETLSQFYRKAIRLRLDKLSEKS